MALSIQSLPEEIRLAILSFLPASDLWLSVKHVNNQYRNYAEEVATKHLLPRFTIGMHFSLSSDTHQRWQAVRGTVQHGFKEINKLNPQYALFETIEVLPKNYQDRVLETWNRMCISGFGLEQEWRVTFPPTGILMKMPTLVLSSSRGIWCDWRQLLDGYFARLPAVWNGVTKDSY